MILWPPDARIENSDGVLKVIVGDRIMLDGDIVELGGGEYKGSATVEPFVGAVPSECISETYWLASEVLSVQ